MENEKVKVISNHSGSILVSVPTITFKREWPAKGFSIAIAKDQLEELMFDNGFKYMIDTGMLYIEDMEVKKELGIEPEDATEPVNVIILSDEQKKRYLTVMPFVEFQEKIKVLGKEQLNDLADFAIKNDFSDFKKAEAIRKLCDRDIITAIRLKAQDKED